MNEALLSKAAIAVFGNKFFVKNPTFDIEKNIEFIGIDSEYYVFIINDVECWILKENMEDLKTRGWSTRKKYSNNL